MTPKGNKNAQVHGGEAAIKALQAGKPLTGLAYAEQQAVEAELQANGVPAIIKGDATRLQTVTNLYWNAVIKAAEAGDIEALDRYVARYGWLSGVTLRAWTQVQANEKDAAKSNNRYVDAIQAMEGGKNDED